MTDRPGVNGVLGSAVISDFDGTLACLDVPWARLRETLSVGRIDDLWRDPGMQRWSAVTAAEVEAARTAAPVPFVMDALSSVTSIAVLTSNDEAAVQTFLDRWPELSSKVGTIVGRRALAGPKTDFEVFSAGYASCRQAVAGDHSTPVTYIGDQDYELEFARLLGATAYAVSELDTAPREPGRD